MIGLTTVSFYLETSKTVAVVKNQIIRCVRTFAHPSGPCPCVGYKGSYRNLCICIMLFCINLGSGCGTTTIHSQNQPITGEDFETGRALASIARSLLGVPYRWGGTSRKGLDCSGLVQYAHLKLGIDVPRNSRAQQAQSSPVHPARLNPGDLVFFRISRLKKSSHVGIYMGDGRFIHAPSNGKSVSYASLQNPFWKDRLVAAGRFY